MSRWTHINGSIRVDWMRGVLPPLPFDEIFKTCDYDDDEAKWKECNVPKGSEGSVRVICLENPNENDLAAYTVVIYGDLRDFGEKADIDGVRDWFYGVCKKLKMIRQAILQVEDEGEENSCVLEYKPEVKE